MVLQIAPEKLSLEMRRIFSELLLMERIGRAGRGCLRVLQDYFA